MTTNLSFSSLSKQKRSQKWGISLISGNTFFLLLMGATAIIMIYLVISVDEICMALNGASFRSSYEIRPIEPLPMSPPPMQLVSFAGSRMQAHDTIYFLDGEFNWSFSDLLLSGPYRCKSGKIVAHLYNAQKKWSITGIYDPSSGILLWGTDIYIETTKSKPQYPPQERVRNVALAVLAVAGLIATILLGIELAASVSNR